MRKRLAAVFMVVLFSVTACGKSEEVEDIWDDDTEIVIDVDATTDEESPREEIQVAPETTEISEIKETDEEETNEAVTTMEAEKSNLYMKFLLGEEPLYFDHYMHGDYYGEFYESGKGYTLSEIMEVLKRECELEKEPLIKYAEMDCGNDGIKELALLFEGMDIYGPDDDSTMVYIIKDMDGRLELCYEYATWARSESIINYYGYYVSWGSGGASLHGESSGYVDASGNWNFIEDTEEQMDIEMLSGNDVLGKIPQIAATKTFEGNIVLYTTMFEEIITEDDYYNIERYYSFDVSDIEYPEEELYTTSVYKEIFDEAGVTVYTPDEIEKMIRKKEEQVGVTETIKNGPELQFMLLEDR